MTVKISETTNIDSIQIQEQAGNPSTPASGYGRVFCKSDGMYFIGDDGNAFHLPTRVLIEEIVAGGASGTVSFTGIPDIYQHLEIMFVADSDSSGVTSEDVYLYLNNDTIAVNYRSMYFGGNGITPSGVGASAATSLMFKTPAANSPANSAASGRVTIPFYAVTTFYHHATCEAGRRDDDNSVYEFSMNCSLEWENTVAISRIDFVLDAGNFVAGSTFRLYGEY